MSEQKQAEFSQNPISPEKTANFKHYIFRGGQLIKEGRYNEAIKHFKNEEELTKIQWSISPTRQRFISEMPKPDEYKALADFVAINSRTELEEKRIVLSGVGYYLTGADGLPQKQDQALPAQLQHEISLVYMEEWLHCLQNIQGRSLVGEPGHEIDVAVYMKRNEIPMTDAFLCRYDRKEALK